MKTVTLPIETLNKVLQYLSYQPFGQVSELIAEIQKTAKTTDTEDEVTPVKIETQAKEAEVASE